MQSLNIGEITDAVSGSLLTGNSTELIQGLSIDSRTIESGQLFVAIIGEHHDGHSFITEAVNRGAAAVIAEKEVDLPEKIPLIIVEDTTEALQQLANYYRNLFSDLRVIAVTGSAGKTTTKDLIAGVLAQKFRVLKTEGNLNNYYGLPLTLFDLKGDEAFAVLEMGMSARGEIRNLARIAEPDIGVVTNVGPAHLETLKTIENVARAKGELIAELPEEGCALLNFDDQYVRQMNKYFAGSEVLYFSLEDEQADFYVSSLDIIDSGKQLNFNLKYNRKMSQNYRTAQFQLPKPGFHNVYNALPACILGLKEGLSSKEIQAGLSGCDFSDLRMEIIEGEYLHIINDSYNANPLSVKAALDVLGRFPGGRKIAVLGDMLELGPEEIAAHREIGKYIVRQRIDYLLTLGDLMVHAAKAARKEGMPSGKVFNVNSKDEIADILNDKCIKGDYILLKGSRGMEMEKIMELIDDNLIGK